MVGAIEQPGLQVVIRRPVAAFGAGHLDQVAFQRNLARAPRGNVAGRAVRAPHLDVQVGHRGFQRPQRMGGVVPGAEQAAFLGGHRQEQQAARRTLPGGKHPCDLDQRGDGSGVVDRAVDDGVAAPVRIGDDPEAVPVPGHDHGLLRAAGTGQDPGHVAAGDALALDIEGQRRAGTLQPIAGEAALLRPGLLRLEIQPRFVEQPLRDLALDPAAHRQVVVGRIGADDVVLRTVAAVAHGRPRVGRRRGLVHDQRPGRAAPRGFLVLVGPAAVVGHRLAAEIALATFEIRIVDQDHHDLVLHVQAGVVVPAQLRGGDAVAGEHQRHVLQRHLVLRVQGLHRDVLALDQRAGAGGGGEPGPHRPGDLAALQLDPLEPATVVAGGLQPGLGEALGDVLDGLFLARGIGRAALERVRGQHPQAFGQVGGLDVAAGNGTRLPGGGAVAGPGTCGAAQRQQQSAHGGLDRHDGLGWRGIPQYIAPQRRPTARCGRRSTGLSGPLRPLSTPCPARSPPPPGPSGGGREAAGFRSRPLPIYNPNPAVAREPRAIRMRRA